MKEAIRQAKKAYALGEVPIGCVIVYQGKIIGRGYNRRNTDKNTLAHAEITAINKASKKMGDWRLEGCTLYVTLEPCQMCAGAIVQARIDEVVMACMNPKAGCGGSILNILEMPEFNHQVKVVRGVLEEECSAMLTNFFKELRVRVKREKELRKMFLPEKIRELIADEKYEIDNIGMSESSVLKFKNKILKVQEYNEEARNEYRMLQYLSGKLPVPLVYAHEISSGKSYLLMSKCEGEMACFHEYMENPAILCKLLAEGLKKLWSIDISDCPSDQRLSRKLVSAEYNIKNGLVDLDNVEPDTFGENGFKDPAELLQWLYENKPEEELVLSHGDYCLPNIFGIHDEVTGYIDLGRAGIADKWCDIALCYRSLSHNYGGKYKYHANNTYLDYDESCLFRELGIKPNWEKIRYYLLLDELF